MTELRKKLRPHSTDPAILRKSAEIYRRGKTPELTRDGAVAELDVRPGGPDLAARHVREIGRTVGADGVRRTMEGLHATRGNHFVLQMLAADPGVRELVQPTQARSASPAPLMSVLRANESGEPLPAETGARFEKATGQDVGGVRVFDDSRSHAAAAAIGARAFTVGRRIYFGRGEYDPRSEAGQELIAHELVHTAQQRGAAMPSPENLEVSSPNEGHERQAERAARSVVRAGRPGSANDGELVEDPVAAGEALDVSPMRVARVQRVISFTTAVGNFGPNNVVADETTLPDGFILTSPVPTFHWQPDVTIHGDAGDAFADWETAHHQVAKSFWFNVWWGTGTNRTHRRRIIDGGLPMRDATAAGNTWYSDFRAQGFTADGDVMSPILRDTPSTGLIPWDNPMPPRVSTRGWFNYGFGFVATVSARHIPDGTGAGAFRHLNHLHWNFMLDGTFDTTQPVGARVTVSDGVPNRSGMIPGIDTDNPPMHGGPIVNDNFLTTDT